jgi:deoxyribodipyrimidine photo-lyase
VEELPTTFRSREELVAKVASISPWVTPGEPSPFAGGLAAAEERLGRIDPVRYGRTRNHLDGAVSRLSPYIRHGILSLNRVRAEAIERVGNPDRMEKFIQELAWRDYWQRVYEAHPDWIWNSIEPYKTGWTDNDYADSMPEDIAEASTDAACINAFIHTLQSTGYLHNHARMYLASYIVHWRRIRWQTGAAWMMSWLLDGDPASNNLSWQWVASTFSRKPYIFNLANVQKYTGDDVDARPETNRPLDATYETLTDRLFPNQGRVQ